MLAEFLTTTLPDDLRRARELLRTGHVTDAQSAYARGELHKVGLLDYFDPIVVSGDHGYRKPDRRLFQLALFFGGQLGVEISRQRHLVGDGLGLRRIRSRRDHADRCGGRGAIFECRLAGRELRRGRLLRGVGRTAIERRVRGRLQRRHS